jgi:hypothetical protein
MLERRTVVTITSAKRKRRQREEDKRELDKNIAHD